MAGMASDAAKMMARKRWSGTTAEARSAAGRARVAKRWAKPAAEPTDDTAYTPAELCEALAGCLPAHLRPYWQPRLAELLSALR